MYCLKLSEKTFVPCVPSRIPHAESAIIALLRTEYFSLSILERYCNSEEKIVTDYLKNPV